MRITRPFVLLALAVLLAPRIEASRTSVSESNRPFSLTATKTDVAPVLAPFAPVAAADAETTEPPLFDLGYVVLADEAGTDAEHFDLGPLTLVDLNLLRSPPPSYPETRVRGFELLPPFHIGASPSLSLWSRQACGFSCREVASDSRYDPWGLITTVTANVGPNDVLPTVNWETGNKPVDTVIAIGNNAVNLGFKFFNAWKNFEAGAGVVIDKADEKAAAAGIAPRGSLAVGVDLVSALTLTKEFQFAAELTSSWVGAARGARAPAGRPAPPVGGERPLARPSPGFARYLEADANVSRVPGTLAEVEDALRMNAGIADDAVKAAGTPRTRGRFGTRTHTDFERLNNQLNGQLSAAGSPYRVAVEEFRGPAGAGGTPGTVAARRAPGSMGVDAVVYENGIPVWGFDLKTGRAWDAATLAEVQNRFGVGVTQIGTR